MTENRFNYTPSWIDGKAYAVCLPTGGSNDGAGNMWDQAAELLADRGGIPNCWHISSICQDAPQQLKTHRVTRGFYSDSYWYCSLPDERSSTDGFRPVLIPLDPETFEPAPGSIAHIEDGDRFVLGTLYMEGIPLPNPKSPTFAGDIPDYIPGASLHIGSANEDPANWFQVIKCGDFLLADRILLKNISWNDLNTQGLVYGGREPVRESLSKKAPSLDEIIQSALMKSREEMGNALTTEQEDVLKKNFKAAFINNAGR